MQRYNPKEIEPKWQGIWDESGTYTADLTSDKPKYIAMSMFNYPSGAGIHIGHAMNYTISDVKARFKRQQGFESYHPVGWDAFGLPAENYAIKAGVSPQESMAKIIPSYHKQYKAMGWSNDWEKEIATHLPEYYKWTQWIFWKMYEQSLAYQDARMQWWCTKCQTVLANEQVIDGKCWRHDAADDPLVEKKEVKQWFFKITEYADELLDAIDDLDWTDTVKLAQKNWIGRSEGMQVKFKLSGLGADDEEIEVFTTAHDTIYGVTFMVFAPEHELIEKYVDAAENAKELKKYIDESVRKSELDREADKEKTGVEVKGLSAINPINGQKIPVWIADYVLVGYGTGAVMAVPGEDERDYEFAQKFELPIVYTTEQQEFVNYQTELKQQRTKYKLANSGEFDGLDFEDGRKKIQEKIEQLGAGELKVNYRMRDWSVSRQRYWGAPIPIVNCPSCYSSSHYDIEIDFAHQAGFEAVRGGQKTVLTRAAEAKYEALEKGSVIKLTSPVDDSHVFAKVSSVKKMPDVASLMNTDIPKRTFMKDFTSADELRAEYDSNRKGYSAELDKKGIVVVEFNVLVQPILLPEDHLPVVLPELDDFQPAGDGRSALARATDWLEVDCPKCGGKAERETDTLDTYICSSWYMYRYFDPRNQEKIFDSKIVKKWEPIDFYNGADHATAHLLYARFIGHFFKKLGMVDEPEPFKQFLFNGKVTAADGTMFSKSKGNGVDPLEIIEQGYGADALRTYLMFAAPLDQWVRWDPQGVPGTYRFLSRIWTLVQEYLDADKGEVDESRTAELRRATHAMVKKMTVDMEENRYNTAIAAAMTAVNDLYKLKADGMVQSAAWQDALERVVACVAPFAPHMADELWLQLGHHLSVHKDSWPSYDDAYLAQDTVTIAVQVNGKLRGTVDVPVDADEVTTVEAAKAEEKVASYLDDQNIVKTIYVPKKLVSFVVK